MSCGHAVFGAHRQLQRRHTAHGRDGRSAEGGGCDRVGGAPPAGGAASRMEGEGGRTSPTISSPTSPNASRTISPTRSRSRQPRRRRRQRGPCTSQCSPAEQSTAASESRWRKKMLPGSEWSRCGSKGAGRTSSFHNARGDRISGSTQYAVLPVADSPWREVDERSTVSPSNLKNGCRWLKRNPVYTKFRTPPYKGGRTTTLVLDQTG